MVGRYDSANFYIFSAGSPSSCSLVLCLHISRRVSTSTLPLQILKQPQRSKYTTLGLFSKVTTYYHPKPNMDPYTVLGVSTGDSMQEIHSQYKKLCLQLHPDKAGEASTAACQRVNAAYQRIVASKKSAVEDVPEESYRRPPQQNNDPLPKSKYRRPLKENRDCSPEPKNRDNRQPGPKDFCKPDHEAEEIYDDLTGP
jgi:hypothetical protein